MDCKGFVISVFALMMLVIIVSLPGGLMGEGEDGPMPEPGEGYFIVGDFEYRILDPVSVELVHVYESSSPYIDVPGEVEHDNRTYTVLSLGAELSSYHDFENIHIPDTIQIINPSALSSVSLSTITVDPENPIFRTDDNGVLYNKEDRQLVRFPAANAQTIYVFPYEISSVGDYAFEGAVGLEEVVGLPDNIQVLGEGVFSGCSSLSRINHNNGCNNLPGDLMYIGSMAFSMCSSLTEITLPENLRVIDIGAFMGCMFSTIHLHSKVHTVEMLAFESCLQLQSITVDSGNDVFESMDGVLMMKKSHLNTYAIIVYPAGKLDETYVIPEAVNDIYDDAFQTVVHLKELRLNDLFINIQPMAFAFLNSLEKVYLPDSMMSIGDMAFYGCKNLSIIEGGQSVRHIGKESFFGTAVTSIMPSPVLENMDDGAYSSCMNLVNVVIPASMEMMGSDVFLDCRSLSSIKFEGYDVNFEESSLSVGTREWFKVVTVTFHEGLNIPSNAFNSYTVPILDEIGKRPYPYENLIGVFICFLILLGIFRLFRQV